MNNIKVKSKVKSKQAGPTATFDVAGSKFGIGYSSMDSQPQPFGEGGGGGCCCCCCCCCCCGGGSAELISNNEK